jgi:hypothetical protein
MDRPNHNRGTTPLAAPGGPKHGRPIDLEQLADNVYRLMLAELRLARARGDDPARHKGR